MCLLQLKLYVEALYWNDIKEWWISIRKITKMMGSKLWRSWRICIVSEPKDFSFTSLVESPRGAVHLCTVQSFSPLFPLFTSHSARQILIHVGVFVKKPMVPSPALNNESILVKILGYIPDAYNSSPFFFFFKKVSIIHALTIFIDPFTTFLN